MDFRPEDFNMEVVFFGVHLYRVIKQSSENLVNCPFDYCIRSLVKFSFSCIIID